METEKDNTVSNLAIENLVIEGGGPAGIAFAGALVCLEEYEILSKIKRFAGTSAGAIIAGALAVGYTADEIREVLNETDFNEFKDHTWGYARDVYRLFKKFGYYKGDFFFDWFGEILKKKTGNADITFKEIKDRYGKVLVLTGSCLNKREVHYYHHQSNPKMPVRLAVRISMSIPLFFKAVRWHDDILVDGGLLNNYPLYVFDDIPLPDSKKQKISFNDKIKDSIKPNQKTLGLKILRPDETDTETDLFKGNDEIDGFITFCNSIVNSMFTRIEQLHASVNYHERTVPIYIHDIGMTQFDVSEKDKKLLIKAGYDATKEYLTTKLQSEEYLDFKIETSNKATVSKLIHPELKIKCT